MCHTACTLDCMGLHGIAWDCMGLYGKLLSACGCRQSILICIIQVTYLLFNLRVLYVAVVRVVDVATVVYACGDVCRSMLAGLLTQV